MVEAAHKVNADVVLIDMAPSSEFMNRVIAMSSDYILPPSFADFLCLSSAEGLLRYVLPLWYEWHEKMTKAQAAMLRADRVSADAKPFLLPARSPFILPFLVSALVVRKPGVRHRERTLLRYSSIWSKQLEQVVKKVIDDTPAMAGRFIPNFSNKSPLRYVMTLIPEVRACGQARVRACMHGWGVGVVGAG